MVAVRNAIGDRDSRPATQAGRADRRPQFFRRMEMKNELANSFLQFLRRCFAVLVLAAAFVLMVQGLMVITHGPPFGAC